MCKTDDRHQVTRGNTKVENSVSLSYRTMSLLKFRNEGVTEVFFHNTSKNVNRPGTSLSIHRSASIL